MLIALKTSLIQKPSVCLSIFLDSFLSSNHERESKSSENQGKTPSPPQGAKLPRAQAGKDIFACNPPPERESLFPVCSSSFPSSFLIQASTGGPESPLSPGEDRAWRTHVQHSKLNSKQLPEMGREEGLGMPLSHAQEPHPSITHHYESLTLRGAECRGASERGFLAPASCWQESPLSFLPHPGLLQG